MGYEVQTAVFEGPFDLLLHLILREQVDLYEVSLCTIVDAYLAEVARFESCDLEVATEFLLIAATLVELKTRRLLPGDDDGDLDDELALWEERDLLLARLLECQTFKDAAAALSHLAADAGRSHPRTAGLEERFAGLAPDLLAGVSPLALRDALARLLSPAPAPRVDLEHLAPVRLSVTEAAEELADEVRRAGRVSFRRLTADLVDRLDVVVRFLALLELYKQGVVELDQVERFGDIDVTWQDIRLDEHDHAHARGVLVDLAAVDAYEG